jgi:coproporphyrinogen III oxidase-like Fe-S oxidoreductase
VGGNHSSIQTRNHVRTWNAQDLNRYLEDPIGVQDGEELTDEQVAMEHIMLALRTADGISEEYLRKYCGPDACVRALAEGGLVRLPDGRVRIPEDRFFISDAIISDLV